MLSKLNQPVDLTKGTPWKGIFVFALPMVIGNIAQQLYSTVDSIVVGNEVGDNALAALMTRGIAEIARLGIALGASRDTFAGLAGLGDF